MQAYMSRLLTPIDAVNTSQYLDPLCAYCGDACYAEYDPDDYWVYDFFHINDNTPICDAKL